MGDFSKTLKLSDNMYFGFFYARATRAELDQRALFRDL